MSSPNILRFLSGTSLGIGLAMAGGCSSPLDPGLAQSEPELRRSIIDSARRELVEAERYRQQVQTTRVPRIQSLDLKPQILAELEKKAGPGSYDGEPTLISESLHGLPQESVSISLERAVVSTVANNLNVQFARLAPAVDQARLVAAQAAFDWTLFSSFQWGSIDNKGVNSSAFIPTPSFDQRQTINSVVGARKRLTTGGTLTVQQSLEYQYVTTANNQAFPNPSDASELTLQLDQPLLRNFGSDVALAQVRLAENSERDKVQQLKGELLQRVTDAESAYWAVVRATNVLKIQRRLLRRGEEVRDVLAQRKEFDTNPSQYASAVAAVESRRGEVISAENALRAASDDLKLIMNDPDLTVGSELLVMPVDRAVDAPVSFSVLDCVTTALANRPEVFRSLLAIDDSSIRQQLADNARLPLLDLRAQMRFVALEDRPDEALVNQADGKLVNFLLGLQFEQPLGNRAAEAALRSRRLERSQAIVVYRDTVRRVIDEVKRALRDVDTSYKLIEQRKAARVSSAEELRTLEVREKTLQGLTPEFLDLKLRRQEAVAQAEQLEFVALTQYQVSLARLYSAMGTALERNRIEFDAPRTATPGVKLLPAMSIEPIEQAR